MSARAGGFAAAAGSCLAGASPGGARAASVPRVSAGSVLAGGTKVSLRVLISELSCPPRPHRTQTPSPVISSSLNRNFVAHCLHWMIIGPSYSSIT